MNADLVYKLQLSIQQQGSWFSRDRKKTMGWKHTHRSLNPGGSEIFQVASLESFKKRKPAPWRFFTSAVWCTKTLWRFRGIWCFTVVGRFPHSCILPDPVFNIAFYISDFCWSYTLTLFLDLKFMHPAALRNLILQQLKTSSKCYWVKKGHRWWRSLITTLGQMPGDMCPLSVLPRIHFLVLYFITHFMY